jgi:hypothetical protein
MKNTENKPEPLALRQKEAYSNRVCELVKTLVSSYYELPITAYDSKSRKRQVIKMKQATVYFIRQLLPKATLNYIGSQMQYDHATVLHCLKCISNLQQTDRETQMDIQALQKNIELETDSVRLDGNISREYHYISLDVCNSYKFEDTRGIVLSNFDVAQLKEFETFIATYYKLHPTRYTHKKTGLFIIDKNKDYTNNPNKPPTKTLLEIINTDNEPNILQTIVDNKI